jgi:hypothetical protein
VISPFFIYDLITSYMYLEVGAFVLSKETGFNLSLSLVLEKKIKM